MPNFSFNTYVARSLEMFTASTLSEVFNRRSFHTIATFEVFLVLWQILGLTLVRPYLSSPTDLSIVQNEREKSLSSHCECRLWSMISRSTSYCTNLNTIQNLWHAFT